MNLRELMKTLGLTEIVGLDYETYYDQQYTLRSISMSTTEYVRDERFKAHLVGIRSTKRKTRWIPHDKIGEALRQYDWSTTGMLAHHAHFDGLISSHHYGIVPAHYFCSLSMARAIFSNDIGAGLDEVARYMGYGGKQKADALDATKGIRDLPQQLLNPLGDYCCDDVNDMWSIFTDFIRGGYPLEELQLIDTTVRAYADPVLEVDRELATSELQREIKERHQLVMRVSKFFPSLKDEKFIKETAKKLNIAKPSKEELITMAIRKDEWLGQAFELVGITPPKKYSVKQKKQVYAFAKNDLDFQTLEAHPKKAVRDLYHARLSAKSTIAETRAARLLSHSKNGRLPIYLNYWRAHTGRWSGGDKMNPQNFGRGSALRRCMKAPKGYQVVVVDSSQIEARKLAYLAQQVDLLTIFGTGGDPYSDLASEIYNRHIDKHKDKTERFVGKVGVLGLGYGMGAEKYQYTLAVGAMGPPVFISLEEAQKVVSVYRRKNYKIVQFWKFLEGMLAIMLNGGRYEFHPLNPLSAGMANKFKRTVEPTGPVHEPILVFRGDGKGNGFVDLPNGMTLHYPKMEAKFNPRSERYEDFSYQSSANGRSKIYGGLFAENITQALARIVVAQQALKIAKLYRIVLLVHDEVVYLAKMREAKKALALGLQALSTPPDWCNTLPTAAEGGFDDVYSK